MAEDMDEMLAKMRATMQARRAAMSPEEREKQDAETARWRAEADAKDAVIKSAKDEGGTATEIACRIFKALRAEKGFTNRLHDAPRMCKGFNGPEWMCDINTAIPRQVLEVLRAIDAKYPDSVWLTMYGSEANPHCEFHISSPEFYDDYPKAGIRVRLTAESILEKGFSIDHEINDLLKMFSGSTRSCPYESIEVRLAPLLFYIGALDLLETLFDRVISAEFGSINTHVLYPPRTGDYGECPELIAAVDVNPHDFWPRGFVLPFAEQNYRVVFDWERLISDGDDSGWMEGFVPLDHRAITFTPTDDPVTNGDKDAVLSELMDDGEELFGSSRRGESWMKLGGKGRSQQEDCAPNIQGLKPYCIATWEAYGADFTWCLMVSVDEAGLPLVCWLDGSCT